MPTTRTAGCAPAMGVVVGRAGARCARRAWRGRGLDVRDSGPDPACALAAGPCSAMRLAACATVTPEAASACTAPVLLVRARPRGVRCGSLWRSSGGGGAWGAKMGHAPGRPPCSAMPWRPRALQNRVLHVFLRVFGVRASPGTHHGTGGRRSRLVASTAGMVRGSSPEGHISVSWGCGVGLPHAAPARPFSACGPSINVSTTCASIFFAAGRRWACERVRV